MLAVLACLIAVSLSGLEAQAATAVTGDRDTNSPLEIVPSGDPATMTRPSGWNTDVAFIQKMPVTKTVSRVTLGDLGLADSCTTGANIRVWVYEHPNGDYDQRRQVTYSLDRAAAPPAPAKITWDIPATTFKAGNGYTSGSTTTRGPAASSSST